jgi:hypothetical protein
MCGRASPFRQCYLFVKEAMPSMIVEAQPLTSLKILDGKAKPFPTSGGRAATP